MRAYFDSTVRIVCTSPPNDNINVPISFEVSLNGVDWTTSGFTYSYYNEPEIGSIIPDAGPSRGGTTMIIKGRNFPLIKGS